MATTNRWDWLGFWLVTVAVLAAAVSHAQAPVPTRVIGRPEIEYASPFSNILGVRELSDERVVITDSRERRIEILDFRTGRAMPVGREGQGPGEFLSIGQPVPARGDTSWMLDISNGRLFVITPSGVAAPPIPLRKAGNGDARSVPGVRVAGRGSASAPPLIVPEHFDTSGRLYESKRLAIEVLSPGVEVLTWGIVRWSGADRAADTLLRFETRVFTSSPDGFSTRQGPLKPAVPPGGAWPFTPQDAWTTGLDGSVAVVRGAENRVEWLLPDGRRVLSAAIPHVPLRVTDAEREQARERGRVNAGRAAAVLGARAGGARPATPVRGLPRSHEAPEFKPAYSGSTYIASDGRLWIPLTRAMASDPQAYDVIDRQGKLVERVTMPPRTLVVGFGKGVLYTVRLDDVDLQYLQRHRM